MQNPEENNVQGKQLLFLTQLSNAYETVGYLHFAAAYYIQRLALCRMSKRHEEVRILIQLAHIYDELGNVDEAIESCEQGILSAREIGDRQTECLALATLGIAYIHLGYAQQALAGGERSLSLASQDTINIPTSVDTVAAFTTLTIMQCLGDAYSALAQPAQAIPYYQQGLAHSRTMRADGLAAIFHEKLGLANLTLGNSGQAFAHFVQASQLATQVHALYTRGRIHAHMGDYYSSQHQWEQAEFHLSHAHELLSNVHLYRGQILLVLYSARFRHRQGRLEEASHSYSKAIKLFDDVQDRYNQATCVLEYAHLLHQQGFEDEAQRMARFVLSLYRERGTEEQVTMVERWLYPGNYIA